jgi:hypothetical protein
MAVAGKSMCDIKGAGKMGKVLLAANLRISRAFVTDQYLGTLYSWRSLRTGQLCDYLCVSDQPK